MLINRKVLFVSAHRTNEQLSSCVLVLSLLIFEVNLNALGWIILPNPYHSTFIILNRAANQINLAAGERNSIFTIFVYVAFVHD